MQCTWECDVWWRVDTKGLWPPRNLCFSCCMTEKIYQLLLVLYFKKIPLEWGNILNDAFLTNGDTFACWFCDFPYLEVSKWSNQFYRHWQKTQDSWIRDKDLYYSQHSWLHELHVISGPLFPQVLWGSCGVVWVVDTVDLYTAKETKILESPSLVKGLASKSVNFWLRGRHLDCIS